MAYHFVLSGLALLALVLGGRPAHADPYEFQVLLDDPVGYWRHGESGPGAAFVSIANLGLAAGDASDGYYAFPVPIDVPGPRPIDGFGGLDAANIATPFGTNDARIEVLDRTDYDLSNGFTASFLVNPSASGGTLLTQGDASTDQRSLQIGFDSAGRLFFEVSRTGKADLGSARLTVPAFPPDRWTHVEVHYKPGESMEIFVDGVRRARRTAGVPERPFSSAERLLMGNDYAPNRDPFVGSLDEVALFTGAGQGEQQTLDRKNALHQGGAREVFGRPHTPLPGTQLTNESSGALEIRDVGGSGAGGFSVALADQGAEQTGYSIELATPGLEQAGGRAMGLVVGVKIAGVPFPFCFLAVDSTGAGVDSVTASCEPHATHLTVQVFDGQTPVGAFTEPAGLVATVPESSRLIALGSLAINGSEAGVLVELDDAFTINPSSGGTPLVGDTLKLVATDFDASTLTVSNLDVLGFGTDFSVLDEYKQDQLPEPIPGDIDGDGKVNNQDLNILGRRWQETVEPFSEGDFNGDGRIDAADLNVIGQNWQRGV